jgi:hypothetical protein
MASSVDPKDALPTSTAQPAILLTTSCTTGWADWVHGELWLTPNGLLRLSLGLPTTIRKSLGIGFALAYDRAARESAPRYFDQQEIDARVARKRRNIWVPWGQIREATLRRGFITSRLRMTLFDGRTVKFLWLPDHRTVDLLRDPLAARLGPNFRIG